MRASVLINFYAWIARPIARWSILLWLILAVAAGFFLFDLLRPSGADGRVPLSLIVVLWAGFLIAVGRCFAELPAPVDPQARFPARLAARIKRGLLWLLAIATTALFGLVALLSVRAVGMYVRVLFV